MAGMGGFLLMDVNCSLRSAFSDAGQQADAVGFHSRNGHPFACDLLLERRTNRKTLEQRRRQLTTPKLTGASARFLELQALIAVTTFY
jgi:hypothetical protein